MNHRNINTRYFYQHCNYPKNVLVLMNLVVFNNLYKFFYINISSKKIYRFFSNLHEEHGAVVNLTFRIVTNLIYFH